MRSPPKNACDNFKKASMAETLTVGDLWAQTTEVLKDRVRARWLCEVACALSGEEFVQARSELVTERMVAHLDAMVARVRSGEPIQYVCGQWAFRHLDLAVDARVLIPRPETELVAEVAIAWAAQRHRDNGQVTAVDLGTGSGAIGLSLARELPLEGVSVWCSDLDLGALDVARSNLAGLGRYGRNVTIVEGSWWDALPQDLTVDLVVSNPPYIADGDPEVENAVSAWEPSQALYAGSDGLNAIRAIVDGAKGRVHRDGLIVLEIGHTQGEAVLEILQQGGWGVAEIHPDLAGRDRIAVGRGLR
jgi:release factor glutamine methyltransferase